jgi:hypothetical protein
MNNPTTPTGGKRMLGFRDNDNNVSPEELDELNELRTVATEYAKSIKCYCSGSIELNNLDRGMKTAYFMCVNKDDMQVHVNIKIQFNGP